MEKDNLQTAAAQPLRCSHCDDTGDVHDATGEWRGRCVCPAASTQASEPSAEPVAFVHWPMNGAPRLVWHSNAAMHSAIRKSHEGHQPDLLLYPAAPARAVEPGGDK